MSVSAGDACLLRKNCTRVWGGTPVFHNSCLPTRAATRGTSYCKTLEKTSLYLQSWPFSSVPSTNDLAEIGGRLMIPDRLIDSLTAGCAGGSRRPTVCTAAQALLSSTHQQRFTRACTAHCQLTSDCTSKTEPSFPPVRPALIRDLPSDSRD